MKKMYFMLSFLIVLVLSGCATQEAFVKKYNEWVGQNISAVINTEGYPNSSYDVPNGNKVYVYNKSYISYQPSFGGLYGRRGYFGFMGYDEVITRTCTLFFEADKNGKIVKWGSRGNSCVAEEEK